MGRGRFHINETVAGVAFTVLFHLVISLLLFSAASAGRSEPSAVEGGETKLPRRRPAFGESADPSRRFIEGPVPRPARFGETSRSRRPVLDLRGRRTVMEAANRPYRFIELASGRRNTVSAKGKRARGIDFGEADQDMLTAMLVPRLGMKQADPRKLPRLTKYEAPERVEDGINISSDNPDGKAVKFKAFDKKKAEYDRKRKKKPSLADLIDGPEDDDERKRPTRLEDIVGVADGAVWGEGTEGKVGDRYLAEIERSIRSSFNVPVFLSQDELKKLAVEVEIRQMDRNGRIVAYKLRRKSSSSAFDSAAVEAIKRFVSAEGGSKTLPVPKAGMLEYINRRGILVRLEGKKLR